MSSQPQQQPSPNPPQGSNSYNRRGRGKYSKARKPAEQSDSLEQAQNRNEGRSRPSGPSVVPKSTRSRKFGGQLSSPTPEQSTATESVSKPGPSHRSTGASSRHESTGSTVYSQLDGVNVPDLTKKLIENLRTPPYADCVICFSPIHPLQPVWTCTVSEETNRCCWGVFHNKCIVAWSKKNIQETRAAYQARNEDKEAEWRCPGCQTPRTNPPGPYKCFCGAVVDPKAGRLAMPHSCGMSCQRNRISCDHPCPLSCHPGPCPPCSTLIVKPCYCGSTSLSLRCSHMASVGEMPLSCGAICGKTLQCHNHRCSQVCHPGECLPCGEVSTEQCYCGRSEKVLNCGEGEPHECSDGKRQWRGRFPCEQQCSRQYTCGKHACTETCHPHPTSDLECPRSVNKITTCPCGQETLEQLGVVRTSCTDPIPTCTSTCGKLLNGCDHSCSAECHRGPCPPCRVEISLPCRCGETITRLPCWQASAKSDEILCTKVCRALRNCGKHVCNRPCCPLSHIGKATKGKARQQQAHLDSGLENLELHECDLTCGKLLNCGLHRCERKDHKGLCPPCLQSSFDEMTCACGNTTLMPPIPCGTQMQCNYPCNRPPPLCGHPKAPHTCHESEPCPPCVYLTSKACACGQSTIPNVRCSQPKVSCGTPCGKLLSCGSHPCPRICHNDECGTCENTCGKDRKLCLPEHHPCTKPCHAPSTCPELDPCQSIITLECPCGRIKRQAPCGRCEAAPSGRTALMQPKCTSECQIAARNARLAEALGIDRSTQGISERVMAHYAPELQSFARANLPFVRMVEAAFSDFVSSDRSAHTLPHMPELKRNFVYNLAKVYRMDARMVDAEPQRSVELIRRIDTRIANPLLSATVQPGSAPLGKLQTKTSTSTDASPARQAPSSLPPSTALPWSAIASKTISSPARPQLPLAPVAAQRSQGLTYSPARPAPTPLSPTNVRADWEADD